MNELAPIALFVYNRLLHTQKTVASLAANSLAPKSDLFIFSDGAKNSSQIENVENVRKYIKSIKGFKSLTIFEKNRNYGLANSIIDGVTQVVNKYGRIIVLEDDMVLSPFFLEYMNNALTFYENNEEVISIHGYCYPVKDPLPETFFLKGADCWGWATWKHGWKLFEKDTRKLLQEIKNQNLENEFDFNSSIDYMKMLKNQLEGKIDSWAIRWYASAFLNGKFTLYPGISLVSNIGFDSSGTHLGTTTDFDTKISEKKVAIREIPIEESIFAKKAFENYFKTIKPNILRRTYTEIKLLAKKILS
ncbi:MAG: hypothetical protein WCS69_14710 [Ignavibacteriaceae bacterium]|jgi:hypothetical protein